MKSRGVILLFGIYMLGQCNISKVFQNNYDPQFLPQKAYTDHLDQDVIQERDSLTNWLDSGPHTEFYPTAGVAIVVNSQPVYIHYVNSGPEKSYGMASITKIFTGLAIMQLVDAQKIDLDDPVQKFLPNLKIKREGLKSDIVRIRHLLSHTSGLPDLRFYEKQEWIHPSDSGLPFRIPIPIYPAGTHYRYSNQGFMILGKVIEVVSKTSLKEFYQKNIFDPLHMQGAHVRSNYSGAFGIRLTLPDMIQFSSFWLRSGISNDGKRILSRKSFHKMMQAPYYYPEGPNNEYCGLAWRVQRDAKGIQQFFHIGGADGTMVWIQIFPRMNTAVMYLANPPEMKSSVMHRIPYLQYRLGKLASKIVNAKSLPSDYEPSLAQSDRDILLRGTYVSPITEQKLSVDLVSHQEVPEDPSDTEFESGYRAKLSWSKNYSEILNPISTRHYLGSRSGTKYDFVYKPGVKKPVAIATVTDYFERVDPGHTTQNH